MDAKTCGLCEAELGEAIYKCDRCGALTPAGLFQAFPEYKADCEMKQEHLQWVTRGTQAEGRIERAQSLIKQTQEAPPVKSKEWAWTFRQLAMILDGIGHENTSK